jgi:hypothetical protein
MKRTPSGRESRIGNGNAGHEIRLLRLEEVEYAVRKQACRFVVVLGELVLGPGVDEQPGAGHGLRERLREREVLVGFENVQL